jgi:diguanylate cyclase (GGDEF)-like protein
MGKRKHKRYAINHPAILMLNDSIKVDCRIDNFSCGGLFLTPSKNSTYEIPTGTDIRVQVQTQRDTKRVRATIVHTSDNGIGVAFAQNEDELLYYLQRVAKTGHPKQRSHNSSPNQGAIGVKEVAIVNWIHAKTKQFIKSKYQDFVKSACDDLFNAANNADSNKIQGSLFDAYNTFNNNQDEIERLLQENIDSSFGAFSDGNISNNPAENIFDQSGLELVAKEDFEEWVSVVSLTRNSESALSSKLHRLENSLSFLAKQYINDEKNPVSPYSLLWSFKKTFSNIDATLQAKKTLFSSFQNSMLRDIDTLYDEINLHIERQGITGLVQNGDKKNKLHQSTAYNDESQTKTDNRKSKRLTNTLSSLIGFASNKQTPTSSKPTAGKIASKEKIIQSLSDIPAVGQRPIIQKLEERFSNEMGNSHHGVMDNDTIQAIQVTEQLLGSLQQDNYINPEVRSLLESLKIPLVKEAVNDPMLLNDTSHPGYKLLETIGKLRPYFPADKDDKSSTDLLYKTIQDISRLAEQGAQLDVKQVTSHLERIIDQRKNNLKSNLGIVAQSCEHDEQYKSARNSVYKLLCSKLTHREIPIIVKQLLHLGWVGLLVHTLSTFGENDKNVIRLLGVIDLLLDILLTEGKLQPATTIQSEYLIKVIKNGFAKYPLYDEDANRYIEILEAILKSGGAEHPDIACKMVRINKHDIKSLLDQQTTPLPKNPSYLNVEQSWLDLVAGIMLDDWIVEQREHGRVRMLNLAWKNASSTRYVFVDGDGIKRLDTEYQNLANMFKQKQCSLLEDGNIPIVERAVNRLLESTFEQIKSNSDTDDLTGLLRRNIFQNKISDLLEITNDEGDHHIMLNLHIDQFSVINDQCGQKGGDKLLETVSKIIKNYLPDNSMLARVGSDEFGAVIKNCSADEGYHLAESQRRAIENLRYNWDNSSIPTTASVGVVHIDANTASAADVMNMASSACQIAKNDGGNCTKLYSPKNQELSEDLRFSSKPPAIEEALADGNLTLFAQPISPVFIGDDENHHYEVLLRVKGDDGSWIGPNDLIHAAETCNRMRSIDRWVINNIFAWLNNHHQEINNTGLSINLSAQTMDDDSFFAFINDHLKSSPFPNNKITFEITETSLIKNIDKARELVEEIKQKGCKFSLDDFGTGYASYSYLKDFPVDHVKIDGAFIKDILTESSSYAMVKSITDVSHYMGKKVIAEFVESEAALVALRELEVDFAQGYYIGQPVPIKNLIQSVHEVLT